MPTLLNGGMFLTLIPLAVLFFLAVTSVTRYRTSVTRYRCPLVDRQGFPCVHRFTLRTDLEKHQGKKKQRNFSIPLMHLRPRIVPP